MTLHVARHPWLARGLRACGAALLVIAGALAGLAGAQAPSPAGEPKSAKTRVLEAGAKLMQGNAPPARLDIYLVGFHPMKEEPHHQMEAHHFCRQVNEDFAQCVLFDGSGPEARLNGVEFIISERLFATLPPEEQRYWHPHNGEILSGQLVAPGLPAAAEKELMKQKMNSYGKTWHVWNTGEAGDGGDRLPLGPPKLACSFNRDGELKPHLLEQRDRRLEIDSAQKRRQRADLTSLARPQTGVDSLREAFPGAREIPGVVDRASRTPGTPAPASR